jgi:hypothetical protein
MSFLDWLRNLISGPPRVSDTMDDPGEVAADLHEELGAPEEGEADIGGAATTSGPIPPATVGGMAPGRPGSPAGAEAAEAEIESEEAPPDPDP